MGVITRGLVTKGIVAPAQGIFVFNESAFVASASTTIVGNINAAKFSPGDLLVAIFATNTATGSITFTPPAGWTEVVEVLGAPNLNISYKTATASDMGSSPIWTASAAATGLGLLIGFRGAQWDANSGFATGAGGTSTTTLPSVTTGANNSIIAAVYAGSAVTTAAPLFAINSGFVYLGYFTWQNAAIQVSYKLQPTAGASPTVTTNWTAATGSANHGMQISVKPK